MTLHMIVGPPASGKSTYLAQNAGQAPRFDFDAVAATVAGGDATTATTADPVADVVLAMRRGLMGWCLDPETSPPELWVINANPSPSTIDRWVAAGGVFHLVDPGVDECLARAQRAGRPSETETAIRAWYAAPPALPDDYTTKGGPPMRTKDFTLRVKAAGPDDDVEGHGEDLADGEFIAYASVFDNRDSYGDIIRKGAFTETLAEWSTSGNTLPVLYGHDFGDPFSNIGAVVDVVEDDHGLRVKARLDLDNAKGAQVHRLLQEKRLSQMSFAFDVLEGAEMEVDGTWAYEIRRVKLYEVSVVPIGANQETSVVSVKSGDGGGDSTATKADDDTVDKARALLKQALDLLEPKAPADDEDDDTDDGDSADDGQTKSTTAAAVKARLAVLALKECS